MLNEATLNNFISVTFKLLPVTIPEKKLANTIRLETIIIIFQICSFENPSFCAKIITKF
mgnify:FL=1